MAPTNGSAKKVTTQFGARPLKRFLQKVETPLARALIAGELEEGQSVRFKTDGDALKMEVFSPVK